MVRLAMESPGRRTARGEPRVEVERLDDEVPRVARSRGARGAGRSGVNVNGIERLASVAAGGAIAAYALKRKDLVGMLLGVVAGGLVERGVSGRCHVYGALGLTSATDDGGGRRPHRAAERPVQQHGRAAVLDASSARRIERSV